jgi:hypothetical protein
LRGSGAMTSSAPMLSSIIGGAFRISTTFWPFLQHVPRFLKTTFLVACELESFKFTVPLGWTNPEDAGNPGEEMFKEGWSCRASISLTIDVFDASGILGSSVRSSWTFSCVRAAHILRAMLEENQQRGVGGLCVPVTHKLPTLWIVNQCIQSQRRKASIQRNACKRYAPKFVCLLFSCDQLQKDGCPLHPKFYTVILSLSSTAQTVASRDILM